jgi:Flp pilus assembly protein TadD
MNNLFGGQKTQTLEGGISQTNAFKDTVERITYQGQIDERLENMERARTFHDLQMERNFQNMKINEDFRIDINKGMESAWQNVSPMEQMAYNQYNQMNINQFNQNQQFQNGMINNNFTSSQSLSYMNHMHMPMMTSTGIHPSLLEFNNQIKLEQESKPEEKPVEQEPDQKNNGDEILTDIINTMEDQEDERHLNSEFLKFIKRMKTGEIKLNEKENNIEIDESKSKNNIFSDINFNNPDEAMMNEMWNNLENQMKDTTNMNFDNYGGQEDYMAQKQSLFLKDNPFLLNDGNVNIDLTEFSREMLNYGDVTNARFALEAEVNKHSDNAEAWLSLGKIHTENDRDDLAMECFLRALEADPFNADALLALGISCTNEFDEFEAMVHLRNWIKLHHIYNKYFDENNPMLNYEMIRNEMIHDRDDEDYYTKAVRIENLKQNFYREMCNLMENISMNEKIADTDLFIAMGIAHFIPHQNDRAIECFRKAVEVNPKDYNAWNKLGAILAHSKMNDEAIAHYKKALELKPNYARCWANLGIAHFNVDNYDESMKSFLTALKIYKDISHVWSYMSSVTIALKRNDLYELVHSKNLPELLRAYGL